MLVIEKESAKSFKRGGTFLIVLVCTYMYVPYTVAILSIMIIKFYFKERLMANTLLCKLPVIVGLFTLITRGHTHWYFMQFVMHTIGMSVVFVSLACTFVMY